MSHGGSGLADINLAGDGGGNQGGPAFLQQVYGALGFGGERVELGSFNIEKFNNLILFNSRWRGRPEIDCMADIELLLSSTVLNHFYLEANNSRIHRVAQPVGIERSLAN